MRSTPVPRSDGARHSRNDIGIVGYVGLELANAFADRLDVRVPGLDAYKVHDKLVDAGKDRTVVAVPKAFLDAPQCPVNLIGFLPVAMVIDKVPGKLPQHRDAHGDVEPVEHALGAGRHGFRHAADAVFAVGQRRDLLANASLVEAGGKPGTHRRCECHGERAQIAVMSKCRESKILESDAACAQGSVGTSKGSRVLVCGTRIPPQEKLFKAR